MVMMEYNVSPVSISNQYYLSVSSVSIVCQCYLSASSVGIICQNHKSKSKRKYLHNEDEVSQNCRNLCNLTWEDVVKYDSCSLE